MLTPVRTRLTFPRAFLVLALALACLAEARAATPAAAADPVAVEVSPQGTVKAVRQVTARFGEPMVAFGDLGPADPFTVTCPEPGRGRWVDPRIWVYDFARDLPGGLSCTLERRADLRSLAGRPVGGPERFTLSTGGPAIEESIPGDGAEEIEEEQAFLLVLDAEPTAASVLARAGFAVEGLPTLTGVRLIEGELRARVIRTRFPEGAAKPVVVLLPRQRFPSGARVTLVWGKGIASRGGVATSQEQRLAFRVRPAFTATFRCEREQRNAGCIPVTRMAVRFSAPIKIADARRIVLRGPDGRVWQPALERERSEWIRGIEIVGPFPERASFRIELPPGLRDDAGRTLGNASRFPLVLRTEAFPPLAKFAARFGVLERHADPALPVTLRNVEPELRAAMAVVTGEPRGTLEWVRGRILRLPPERATEILPWLQRLSRHDREASLLGGGPADQPIQRFTLPKPGGTGPMEVVGIPLPAPGFYVVEIESARLGASLLGGRSGQGTPRPPRPMYVPAAALVTNLAVHLKQGRSTALVWVTSLDRGHPVGGVRVVVSDCAGTLLGTGRTDAQGLARIERLPSGPALRQCPQPGPWPAHAEPIGSLDSGLFVTAQTQDDLAFVHSSWDEGIEPWRFRLPDADEADDLVAHSILDRALLRTGETVHMKHVIRRQLPRGLAIVDPPARPTRVRIRHLGSEESYLLPLRWERGEVATGSWDIPRATKLGTYEIVLERPVPTRPAPAAGTPAGEPEDGRGEATSWVSGRFEVQEFRVPTMRGTLQPPPEPLVAVEAFPLDLSLQFVAGGGASRHPVVLRAQLGPKAPPRFEPFEEYAFANGALREGLARRGASSEDEDGGDEGPAPLPAAPVVHQREELTLDAAGTGRVVIARLPRPGTPQDVLAEMEFRDASGEVQTVSTRVPVWPARWLVGVRTDDWTSSRDTVSARVAVVDVAGRPVAGAPVTVVALERRFYSHRKRLVGGFYAYEHVEEVRRAGPVCQGTTGADGTFGCSGPPPARGWLVLQASTSDPEGRATAAHREVWVPGTEPSWFDVRDSDRIDLLPERRRYEPGQRARFQVRMPFREATALVTTERDGVLDAWTVPLSGTDPVIEVPVRPEYAPNVFVSALVVRGRTGGVQPTALVDLGRPAFKLGVNEIQVGWRRHELQVAVTADRPVFQVRETATVRIVARTPGGGRPPADTEVAVAAVDEALLELGPNRSWDALEAMMRRRGYGVRTATVQGQVVGKRHFGLKAQPPGGGGGRRTTRELFDTLLVWMPRVRLDPRGEATVTIPLNDSVTSFRVVAVATAGAELFGTGATSIRTTQDLIVLPALAPVVREGDRAVAELTLRNTTARPLTARVTARVEGLPGALPPREQTLAPGEAASVGWEITVPSGVEALRYEIEAEAGGARDRIRVAQRVVPAVPERVYQATLLRADGPLRVPVERPAEALPGRGGLTVTWRPTLGDGLAGVRDWMARYPYGCLEQTVSRAVALRDDGRWRAAMAALPAQVDGDGLFTYFPGMAQGDPVLTAYVLAVAHEAGWTLPDETRDRALEALRKFVTGTLIRRGELPTADLSIRKLVAIEALTRYGRAEAALLDSLAVEPVLWPTSALLDWWSVLHRLPDAPDRERRLREAAQLVRGRLTLSGTTLGFSTESTDALWWLMVSPDVNAVRLALLLLESRQWPDDLPRVVRAAIGRQRGGAWDLTVANAWGTLALEKFSRAFERVPVAGRSTATLGGEARTFTWADQARGGAVSVPWPDAAGPQPLALDHAGTGQPWVTVEARAAVPLRAPVAAGYRISKTLTPIEPRRAGQWSRGDLVRVRIEIDAQTDMTWVAVTDPIPAGASHVGAGLARHSTMLAPGGAPAGRARMAFEERSFEALRAYYEIVPKGPLVLEYVMRLNQAGRLQVPPTRVEALYAPGVFGERPNAAFEVQP